MSEGKAKPSLKRSPSSRPLLDVDFARKSESREYRLSSTARVVTEDGVSVLRLANKDAHVTFDTSVLAGVDANSSHVPLDISAEKQPKLTIEAWIKVDERADHGGVYIGQRGRVLACGHNIDSNVDTFCGLSQAPTPQGWLHVARVFFNDNRNPGVYLNGSEVLDYRVDAHGHVVEAMDVHNVAGLVLGRHGDFSDGTYCFVKSVRVWGDSLLPETLNMHYQEGWHRPEISPDMRDLLALNDRDNGAIPFQLAQQTRLRLAWCVVDDPNQYMDTSAKQHQRALDDRDNDYDGELNDTSIAFEPLSFMCEHSIVAADNDGITLAANDTWHKVSHADVVSVMRGMAMAEAIRGLSNFCRIRGIADDCILNGGYNPCDTIFHDNAHRLTVLKQLAACGSSTEGTIPDAYAKDIPVDAKDNAVVMHALNWVREQAIKKGIVAEDECSDTGNVCDSLVPLNTTLVSDFADNVETMIKDTLTSMLQDTDGSLTYLPSTHLRLVTNDYVKYSKDAMHNEFLGPDCNKTQRRSVTDEVLSMVFFKGSFTTLWEMCARADCDATQRPLVESQLKLDLKAAFESSRSQLAVNDGVRQFLKVVASRIDAANRVAEWTWYVFKPGYATMDEDFPTRFLMEDLPKDAVVAIGYNIRKAREPICIHLLTKSVDFRRPPDNDPHWETVVRKLTAEDFSKNIEERHEAGMSSMDWFLQNPHGSPLHDLDWSNRKFEYSWSRPSDAGPVSLQKLLKVVTPRPGKVLKYSGGVITLRSSLHIVYPHKTFKAHLVSNPLGNRGSAIDGGGWRLVRHVPAGDRWHSATDQLTGEEEYGVPGSETSASAFSISFNKEVFDEFLFATGDCKKWLIASKAQVTGAYYEDKKRTIVKSSTRDTSYTAVWYRMECFDHHPLVSLTDYDEAVSAGDILYAGGSLGGPYASAVVPAGANVFIRRKIPPPVVLLPMCPLDGGGWRRETTASVEDRTQTRWVATAATMLRECIVGELQQLLLGPLTCTIYTSSIRRLMQDTRERFCLPIVHTSQGNYRLALDALGHDACASLDSHTAADDKRLAMPVARDIMTANMTLPPPRCSKDHKLVVSKGEYSECYFCERCDGDRSEGHNNASRERWVCKACNINICFLCIPKVHLHGNTLIEDASRNTEAIESGLVAWRGGCVASPTSYVEFDLKDAMYIVGIDMRGWAGTDAWVQRYQVQTRMSDQDEWSNVDDDVEYDGNSNCTDMSREFFAPGAVHARHVRIVPTRAHNYIAMQVALLRIPYNYRNKVPYAFANSDVFKCERAWLMLASFLSPREMNQGHLALEHFLPKRDEEKSHFDLVAIGRIRHHLDQRRILCVLKGRISAYKALAKTNSRGGPGASTFALAPSLPQLLDGIQACPELAGFESPLLSFGLSILLHIMCMYDLHTVDATVAADYPGSVDTRLADLKTKLINDVFSHPSLRDYVPEMPDGVKIKIPLNESTSIKQVMALADLIVKRINTVKARIVANMADSGDDNDNDNDDQRDADSKRKEETNTTPLVDDLDVWCVSATDGNITHLREGKRTCVLLQYTNGRFTALCNLHHAFSSLAEQSEVVDFETEDLLHLQSLVQRDLSRLNAISEFTAAAQALVQSTNAQADMRGLATFVRRLGLTGPNLYYLEMGAEMTKGLRRDHPNMYSKLVKVTKQRFAARVKAAVTAECHRRLAVTQDEIIKEQRAVRAIKNEQNKHKRNFDEMVKNGESREVVERFKRGSEHVQSFFKIMPARLSTYQATRDRKSLVDKSVSLKTGEQWLMWLPGGRLFAADSQDQNDMDFYLADERFHGDAIRSFNALASMILAAPSTSALSSRTTQNHIIEGYNILLSECVDHNKGQKSISLIAAGNIFIDMSVTWKGCHVALICSGDVVVTKTWIIKTDGARPGSTPDKPMLLRDGQGRNGKHGEDGAAGNNAGNVCIQASRLIGLPGVETVTLTVQAVGGKGQDGGRGGDGEDATPPKREDNMEIWTGTYSPNNGLAIGWYNIQLGVNGKQGGAGAPGGIGGQGGYHGSIDIKNEIVDDDTVTIRRIPTEDGESDEAKQAKSGTHGDPGKSSDTHGHAKKTIGTTCLMGQHYLTVWVGILTLLLPLLTASLVWRILKEPSNLQKLLKNHIRDIVIEYPGNVEKGVTCNTNEMTLRHKMKETPRSKWFYYWTDFTGEFKQVRRPLVTLTTQPELTRTRTVRKPAQAQDVTDTVFNQELLNAVANDRLLTTNTNNALAALEAQTETVMDNGLRLQHQQEKQQQKSENMEYLNNLKSELEELDVDVAINSELSVAMETEVTRSVDASGLDQASNVHHLSDEEHKACLDLRSLLRAMHADDNDDEDIRGVIQYVSDLLVQLCIDRHVFQATSDKVFRINYTPSSFLSRLLQGDNERLNEGLKATVGQGFAVALCQVRDEMLVADEDTDDLSIVYEPPLTLILQQDSIAPPRMLGDDDIVHNVSSDMCTHVVTDLEKRVHDLRATTVYSTEDLSVACALLATCLGEGAHRSEPKCVDQIVEVIERCGAAATIMLPPGSTDTSFNDGLHMYITPSTMDTSNSANGERPQSPSSEISMDAQADIQREAEQREAETMLANAKAQLKRLQDSYAHLTSLTTASMIWFPSSTQSRDSYSDTDEIQGQDKLLRTDQQRLALVAKTVQLMQIAVACRSCGFRLFQSCKHGTNVDTVIMKAVSTAMKLQELIHTSVLGPCVEFLLHRHYATKFLACVKALLDTCDDGLIITMETEKETKNSRKARRDLSTRFVDALESFDHVTHDCAVTVPYIELLHNNPSPDMAQRAIVCLDNVFNTFRGAIAKTPAKPESWKDVMDKLVFVSSDNIRERHDLLRAALQNIVVVQYEKAISVCIQSHLEMQCQGSDSDSDDANDERIRNELGLMEFSDVEKIQVAAALTAAPLMLQKELPSIDVDELITHCIKVYAVANKVYSKADKDTMVTTRSVPLLEYVLRHDDFVTSATCHNEKHGIFLDFILDLATDIEKFRAQPLVLGALPPLKDLPYDMLSRGIDKGELAAKDNESFAVAWYGLKSRVVEAIWEGHHSRRLEKCQELVSNRLLSDSTGKHAGNIEDTTAATAPDEDKTPWLSTTDINRRNDAIRDRVSTLPDIVSMLTAAHTFTWCTEMEKYVIRTEAATQLDLHSQEATSALANLHSNIKSSVFAPATDDDASQAERKHNAFKLRIVHLLELEAKSNQVGAYLKSIVQGKTNLSSKIASVNKMLQERVTAAGVITGRTMTKQFRDFVAQCEYMCEVAACDLTTLQSNRKKLEAFLDQVHTDFKKLELAALVDTFAVFIQQTMGKGRMVLLELLRAFKWDDAQRLFSMAVHVTPEQESHLTNVLLCWGDMVNATYLSYDEFDDDPKHADAKKTAEDFRPVHEAHKEAFEVLVTTIAATYLDQNLKKVCVPADDESMAQDTNTVGTKAATDEITVDLCASQAMLEAVVTARKGGQKLQSIERMDAVWQYHLTHLAQDVPCAIQLWATVAELSISSNGSNNASDNKSTDDNGTDNNSSDVDANDTAIDKAAMNATRLLTHDSDKTIEEFFAHALIVGSLTELSRMAITSLFDKSDMPAFPKTPPDTIVGTQKWMECVRVAPSCGKELELCLGRHLLYHVLGKIIARNEYGRLGLAHVVWLGHSMRHMVHLVSIKLSSQSKFGISNMSVVNTLSLVQLYITAMRAWFASHVPQWSHYDIFEALEMLPTVNVELPDSAQKVFRAIDQVKYAQFMIEASREHYAAVAPRANTTGSGGEGVSKASLADMLADPMLSLSNLSFPSDLHMCAMAQFLVDKLHGLSSKNVDEEAVSPIGLPSFDPNPAQPTKHYLDSKTWLLGFDHLVKSLTSRITYLSAIVTEYEPLVRRNTGESIKGDEVERFAAIDEGVKKLRKALFCLPVINLILHLLPIPFIELFRVAHTLLKPLYAHTTKINVGGADGVGHLLVPADFGWDGAEDGVLGQLVPFIKVCLARVCAASGVLQWHERATLDRVAKQSHGLRHMVRMAEATHRLWSIFLADRTIASSDSRPVRAITEWAQRVTYHLRLDMNDSVADKLRDEYKHCLEKAVDASVKWFVDDGCQTPGEDLGFLERHLTTPVEATKPSSEVLKGLGKGFNIILDNLYDAVSPNDLVHDANRITLKDLGAMDVALDQKKNTTFLSHLALRCSSNDNDNLMKFINVIPDTVMTCAEAVVCANIVAMANLLGVAASKEWVFDIRNIFLLESPDAWLRQLQDTYALLLCQWIVNTSQDVSKTAEEHEQTKMINPLLADILAFARSERKVAVWVHILESIVRGIIHCRMDKVLWHNDLIATIDIFWQSKENIEIFQKTLTFPVNQWPTRLVCESIIYTTVINTKPGTVSVASESAAADAVWKHQWITWLQLTLPTLGMDLSMLQMFEQTCATAANQLGREAVVALAQLLVGPAKAQRMLPVGSDMVVDVMDAGHMPTFADWALAFTLSSLCAEVGGRGGDGVGFAQVHDAKQWRRQLLALEKQLGHAGAMVLLQDQSLRDMCIIGGDPVEISTSYLAVFLHRKLAMLQEPGNTQPGIDHSKKQLINIMMENPANKDIAHLLLGDAGGAGLLDMLEKTETFRNELVSKLTNTLESTPTVAKTMITDWKLTNKDKMEKVVKHELMAWMSLATYVFSGFKYFPRDSQILASYLMIVAQPNLLGQDLTTKARTGSLVQVDMGEGKSLIIAMTACIKKLFGEDVDVVTSSSVLAKRDALEYNDFYRLFGFSSHNNCDALLQDLPRIERYKQHAIIYGDINNFEADSINDHFYHKGTFGNRNACIIVDEVDSMLLDKAQNTLYLSKALPDMRRMDNMLLCVWEAVHAPDVKRAISEQRDAETGGDTEDEDEENEGSANEETGFRFSCAVEMVSQLLEKLLDDCKLVIPETLKEFYMRQRGEWIENAILAAFIMQRGEDYIVDDQTHAIIILDRDTGEEQFSAQWTGGMHQFLQMKHNLALSELSLKSVFKTNLSFFTGYNAGILGLSGTVGDSKEREVLKAMYDVQTFDIPRYCPSALIYHEHRVCSTKEEQLTELVDSLNVVLFKHRRSALVLCDTITQVEQISRVLNDRFRGKPKRSATYVSTTDILAFGTKDNLMGPGDIMIATNLAGRGTDLRQEDCVHDSGGMHVVLAYVPKNVRVERQAFGRTARKGKSGSAQFIVVAEHSSPLLELKADRDDQSARGMEKVIRENVPRMKAEDGALKMFQVLHSTARTQLLAVYPSAFDECTFMLECLEAQWALWLDKMGGILKLLTTASDYKGNHADYLKPHFADFEASMMVKINSTQCDLTYYPTDQVRLFHILIHKDCDEGFKASFDARNVLQTLAIREPSFAWAAEYYLGYYELFNDNTWCDVLCRNRARYHLRRSHELMTAEVQRQSVMILRLAMPGLTVSADESFKGQVEGVRLCLDTHLQCCSTALGENILPTFFKDTTMDEEKSKKVWKHLVKEGYVTNYYFDSDAVTCYMAPSFTLMTRDKPRDRKAELPIHTLSYMQAPLYEYVSTSMLLSQQNTKMPEVVHKELGELVLPMWDLLKSHGCVKELTGVLCIQHSASDQWDEVIYGKDTPRTLEVDESEKLKHMDFEFTKNKVLDGRIRFIKAHLVQEDKAITVESICDCAFEIQLLLNDAWNSNGGLLTKDMCASVKMDFHALKNVLQDTHQAETLAEMTLKTKTTEVPSDFGGGPHRSADNSKYATIVPNKELDRIIDAMLLEPSVKKVNVNLPGWKRHALTFMLRHVRKCQVDTMETHQQRRDHESSQQVASLLTGTYVDDIGNKVFAISAFTKVPLTMSTDGAKNSGNCDEEDSTQDGDGGPKEEHKSGQQFTYTGPESVPQWIETKNNSFSICHRDDATRNSDGARRRPLTTFVVESSGVVVMCEATSSCDAAAQVALDQALEKLVDFVIKHCCNHIIHICTPKKTCDAFTEDGAYLACFVLLQLKENTNDPEEKQRLEKALADALKMRERYKSRFEQEVTSGFQQLGRSMQGQLKGLASNDANANASKTKLNRVRAIFAIGNLTIRAFQFFELKKSYEYAIRKAEDALQDVVTAELEDRGATMEELMADPIFKVDADVKKTARKLLDDLYMQVHNWAVGQVETVFVKSHLTMRLNGIVGRMLPNELNDHLEKKRETDAGKTHYGSYANGKTNWLAKFTDLDKVLMDKPKKPKKNESRTLADDNNNNNTNTNTNTNTNDTVNSNTRPHDHRVHGYDDADTNNGNNSGDGQQPSDRDPQERHPAIISPMSTARNDTPVDCRSALDTIATKLKQRGSTTDMAVINHFRDHVGHSMDTGTIKQVLGEAATQKSHVAIGDSSHITLTLPECNEYIKCFEDPSKPGCLLDHKLIAICTQQTVAIHQDGITHYVHPIGDDGQEYKTDTMVHMKYEGKEYDPAHATVSLLNGETLNKIPGVSCINQVTVFNIEYNKLKKDDPNIPDREAEQVARGKAESEIVVNAFVNNTATTAKNKSLPRVQHFHDQFEIHALTALADKSLAAAGGEGTSTEMDKSIDKLERPQHLQNLIGQRSDLDEGGLQPWRKQEAEGMKYNMVTFEVMLQQRKDQQQNDQQQNDQHLLQGRDQSQPIRRRNSAFAEYSREVMDPHGNNPQPLGEGGTKAKKRENEIRDSLAEDDFQGRRTKEGKDDVGLLKDIGLAGAGAGLLFKSRDLNYTTIDKRPCFDHNQEHLVFKSHDDARRFYDTALEKKMEKNAKLAVDTRKTLDDMLRENTKPVYHAPLDFTQLDCLLSFGAASETMSFAKVEGIKKAVDEAGKQLYVDSCFLPHRFGAYRVEGYQAKNENNIFNSYWQEHYKKAMTESKSMTFIITKAWLNSENCWQELDWALKYRKEKHHVNEIIFQDKDAWDAAKSTFKGHVDTDTTTKAERASAYTNAERERQNAERERQNPGRERPKLPKKDEQRRLGDEKAHDGGVTTPKPAGHVVDRSGNIYSLPAYMKFLDEANADARQGVFTANCDEVMIKNVNLAAAEQSKQMQMTSPNPEQEEKGTRRVAPTYRSASTFIDKPTIYAVSFRHPQPTPHTPPTPTANNTNTTDSNTS